MRRHSAVSILAETIARASVDLDDESDSASACELPALDAINAMAAEVCSRLSRICAGTRPHLRRDFPTSAPGLASLIRCGAFSVESACCGCCRSPPAARLGAA
jgi:hypothetical protein